MKDAAAWENLAQNNVWVSTLIIECKKIPKDHKAIDRLMDKKSLFKAERFTI